MNLDEDSEIEGEELKRAQLLVAKTMPLRRYKLKQIFPWYAKYILCYSCKKDKMQQMKSHLIWKNIHTQANFGILPDEISDDEQSQNQEGENDQQKIQNDSDSAQEFKFTTSQHQGNHRTSLVNKLVGDETKFDIFENPYYIFGWGIYNYLSAVNHIAYYMCILSILAIFQIVLMNQDKIELSISEQTSLTTVENIVYQTSLGGYSQTHPLCEHFPINVDNMYFACQKGQQIQEIEEIGVVKSKSKLCRVEKHTKIENETLKKDFDDQTKCNQYVSQTFKDNLKKECINKTKCTLDNLIKDVLVPGHEGQCEIKHLSLFVQAKCVLPKETIQQRQFTGLKCAVLGVLGNLIFMFGVSFTLPRVFKRRKLAGIFKTISAKNFTVDIEFGPDFFENLYVTEKDKKWVTCEQKKHIFINTDEDNTYKWEPFDSKCKQHKDHLQEVKWLMSKPIKIVAEETDAIGETEQRDLDDLDSINENNQFLLDAKDPDKHIKYEECERPKQEDFFIASNKPTKQSSNAQDVEQQDDEKIVFWLDQNKPALWLQIKLIKQLKKILIEEFLDENGLPRNDNPVIKNALKKYSEENRQYILEKIQNKSTNLFDIAMISFNYKNDGFYGDLKKATEAIRNKHYKRFTNQHKVLQQKVQGITLKEKESSEYGCSEEESEEEQSEGQESNQQVEKEGGEESKKEPDEDLIEYEVEYDKYDFQKRSEINEYKTPAVAFITFKDPLGAFLCNKFMKYSNKNHQIFGKDLQLSRSSAPSDIHYKNFGCDWKESFSKALHGIILILMWASFFCYTIYFLYSIQQNRQVIFKDFNKCNDIFLQYQNKPQILLTKVFYDYERLNKCNNGLSLQTIAFDKDTISDLGGQLDCFCNYAYKADLDFSDDTVKTFRSKFDPYINKNQTKRDQLYEYCDEVQSTRDLASYMSILIGLTLQLSNIIVKHSVKYVLELMGHTYKSQEKIHIMQFLYGIQISTQMIIVILLGAKLDFLTQIPLLSDNFNGKYRDFSQGWFKTIGSVFLVKMTFMIITPIMTFIVEILFKLQYKPLFEKKRTVWDYYLTNVEQDFLLEVKLAYLIGMLTLTFLFGAGMPILFPMAFVAIICHFILTKYKIAKFHRKPINYSRNIVDRFLYYCQILPLLNSGFGFWMFSNQQIYNNKGAFIDSRRDEFDHQHQWQSVFELTPGTPYLILFVISLINFIYITLERMPNLKCCAVQRLSKKDEEQLRYPKKKPFFDYLSQQQFVRYINLQETMHHLFNTRNMTKSMYENFLNEYKNRVRQLKEQDGDEFTMNDQGINKLSLIKVNSEKDNNRLQQSDTSMIANGVEKSTWIDGTQVAFEQKGIEKEFQQKIRHGDEIPIQISGLMFEILLDTEYQSKFEFPYNLRRDAIKQNWNNKSIFRELQIPKIIFIFNIACMHKRLLEEYRLFNGYERKKLREFMDQYNDESSQYDDEEEEDEECKDKIDDENKQTNAGDED